MALFRGLGRSTRMTCTPFISVFVFALLLTFVFVLYQPSLGPGKYVQRIGWQSWDYVDSLKTDNSTILGPLPIDPGTISIGGGQDSNSTLPPGVDWWDVETPAPETTDSTAFPMDVWNPLLPHRTGLTDIAISRCLAPPSLAKLCLPRTTAEEDALKGPWVRVKRDLNKKDGLWELNLYYRRSRRLDIPLITDIKLFEKGGESELPDMQNWTKVSMSIRDGIMHKPPMYLWYKLGPPLRDLSDIGKDNLITELDVLFGKDRTVFGFEKVETAVNPGFDKVDPVWLSFRRGVKVPPRAAPLHFNRNGTFKILQVADLHFSVSPGTCRDTDREPCHEGDTITEALVSRVLEEEKPDLVIFSGDQLNGQGTSWDARSVLAKFAGEVSDRQIPWAAIFGNHDDENDLSRADQMKILEWLPYSVSSAGPKDVDGVGNYVLKVKSADPSKTQLLTLYMLDSHAYPKKKISTLFGLLDVLDYDWIKQSQIDWFLAESAAIKPIIRPYTPDGGKDLGKSWSSKRQGSEGPLDQRLAKPNAVVFFHIPLPETYLEADLSAVDKHPLDVGSRLDGPGASSKNGGFFEHALLQAPEAEGGDMRTAEVKVVANAHSHASDNCRRIAGIWMCFGGGGSYSGYGRTGFDRRFRVYDILDHGETIRTYKRTEHDEIVDDMILSGRGAEMR